MQLVKKISCIVLAAIMALSMSVAATFAEDATVKDPDGADRVNIVDFVQLWSATKFGDPMIVLADGNRGDNTSNGGDYNKAYGSGEKSTENQCEYSHRGDSTASVTGLPEDKIEAAGTEYYYYVSAVLKGVSKVTGLTMYLQGYKAAVMDHAVDILYSTDDGATWTKLCEARTPFDDGAVYHYVNWDANAGFGATQYGSGKDTDSTIESIAYLYVDLELTPLTGVTNIAWAVYSPRCNNAHYTSRMTEFEVYGEYEAPAVTTEEETSAPAEVTTAADVTTAAAEDSTPASVETTAAPAENTTAAPDATKAPETTPAKDGGCGSSAAACALIALLPAAFCVRRRKHD